MPAISGYGYFERLVQHERGSFGRGEARETSFTSCSNACSTTSGVVGRRGELR